MAKYKYSSANNVFYPYANEDAYRAAGAWPENGFDYDEDDFLSWKTENAPAGKMRATGGDGRPEWVDIPAPSKDEQVTQNEVKKSSLLVAATTNIVVWQTKLLMGRKLTDTETTQLNSWMDYIDSVTAIDTSSTDITWPEQPA